MLERGAVTAEGKNALASRGNGPMIVRIVFAEVVIATILAGLLYAAGMFEGTADNGMDPMLELSGSEY
jgi:hypothetical protein